MANNNAMMKLEIRIKPAPPLKTTAVHHTIFKGLFIRREGIKAQPNKP
jgi:hypothetical protein